MLSTGEILLLNQLLYCPREVKERRIAGGYQENTIGMLVHQWLAQPVPDEEECGICMRGKEWNCIIRLIAENPRLSPMRIQSVHRDEADGGGGGLSAVFADSRLGEAIVVFRGTAAGEWRDDFLGRGIYSAAGECPQMVSLVGTVRAFFRDYGYRALERRKQGKVYCFDGGIGKSVRVL